MSFSPITRKFSIRLTIWYATISLVTTAILFGLAYALISSHFEKEDRTAIQQKQKGYANAYENEALDGLEPMVNAERELGKSFLYLIRVASPQGSTLFLSLPDQLGSLSSFDQIQGIPLGEGFHPLRIISIKEDNQYEVGSFRLSDGNILQVGVNVKNREELLLQLREIFYGALIFSLIVSILGGYFLAYRALRPIRNLTVAIESITQTGDLKTRVTDNATQDELSELVRLFNNMQERIERLVQGMRDSLDNIAHDLRTPLTRLSVSAEVALTTGGGEHGYREALSDCLEESERIARILNALIDISEADAGTLHLRNENIVLHQLVDATLDLYRHVAEEKNIGLRTDIPEDIHLLVDSGKLQQIVSNLIDNAIKYTQDGGHVSIGAQRRGEEEVVITVTDTGSGIPENEIPNIWTRLYRGEKSRSERGMGLGLSIVLAFVRSLGGEISVQSSPGCGTAFIVKIPRKPSR